MLENMKGQTRMDNPEKLAALVHMIEDEDKQDKNT
jgi:hypothetical protein